MTAGDILELNLTDLARNIARAANCRRPKAVSAALARLDQLEGKLNAFITVLREQALAEAKKADEEIARGNYRGPLHGVPVTIKDMFETAGVLTTGGSKILADWIPDTDSAFSGTIAKRRRDHHRQDQSRRVRPRRHVDAFSLRPRSQSLEYRPHRRRLERRLSGGGRKRHRAAFLRHRDRLFGAPARIVLRHRRLQAHLRHDQPARFLSWRLESRSRRAVCAFGERYHIGFRSRGGLRRARSGERASRGAGVRRSPRRQH